MGLRWKSGLLEMRLEFSRMKIAVRVCVYWECIEIDSVGKSLETFRRPELLIKIKTPFAPSPLPLPNISVK